MNRPHRKLARIVAPLALLLGTVAAPAVAAWPIAFGGTQSDEVRIVKAAANGDTYIAGHFRGTMDVTINGQVQSLTSVGGQDVFVVRLNAAGQAVWAVKAGGVNSDDTVTGLVLDDSQNVFIVGEFWARASFGNIDLRTVDNNDDDVDAYVARINANGTWAWAKSYGSDANDTVSGIVALPGTPGTPPAPESLVISGTFTHDQIRFGTSHHVDAAPNSVRDAYMARITVDGNWLWATGRGNDATGYDSAEHLAVDTFRRVWLLGEEASTNGVVFTPPHQNTQPLTDNWSVPSFPGGAGVRYGTRAHTYEPALMFHGNPAVGGAYFEFPSRTIDTTNVMRLTLSLNVQRGLFDVWNHTRSDSPDPGDWFAIDYYASGQWKTLEVFHNGAAGEVMPRTGAQAYEITDPAAMNSQFRIRFRYSQTFAPGQDRFVFPGTWWYMDVPFPDTWHVDSISLNAQGFPRPFVQRIAAADTTAPQLASSTTLPNNFDIASVAPSPDGQRLVLAGTRIGDLNYSPCLAVPGSGATVVSLDISGGSVGCKFAQGASGGTGSGVTVDANGQVYMTGWFSDTMTFDSQTTIASGGGDDIFIAGLNPSLQWRWGTGGGSFDAGDGFPGRAGGAGQDRAASISTGAVGSNLFVGGRFAETMVVGEADELVSRGSNDGFVLTLGRDGRFPREEQWTVGVPLVPPPEAYVGTLTAVPEFRVGGQAFDAIGQKIFAWVGPVAGSSTGKLIPLQASGGVEVRWRVSADLQSTNRVSQFGRNVWPALPCDEDRTSACYQVHVVGAPVEVEPANGQYKVQELVNASSDSSSATYSAGRFAATQPGYASLVYINGPSIDQTAYPTVVEVVRTMAYDDVPQFVDNAPAEIGKKIVDPYHTEPNRTGFVVNELAYYDGHGAGASYNRTARTGQIIPVNRYVPARLRDAGRELVVAWYHEQSKGVYWPDKAVRYQPYWPVDPPRIIIASEQGTEVLGQTRLNPALFPSLAIYAQNDPMLPGYNPNDEHAIMAPSTLGSGFEAVFAMRSDFGSGLAGDVAAASDPYVLLRHFDTASQERRFRVYRVMATGAGFSQFRYSGTAATTVSPPYPLRLLPGCAGTSVVGQVDDVLPPPFFKDYKNQLWSKSAGTGAVQYHYPTQPGFFTDIDNDDVNDLGSGQCVPWLARLPASQGGTDGLDDPILVNYEITWPESVPLLVSGETLMAPKRGLPAIVSQLAVEVVYDQLQADNPDAPPSQTLAQLIDPLNPRSVRINQLPEQIASSMQTNGTYSIDGSADGLQKLPISIGNRLLWRPSSRTLELTGQFDETGAGEPFLLLNVLSKVDRATLKKLDGGDGNEASDFTGTCAAGTCTWDQTVERLFRLSRNPQAIANVCRRWHVSGNARVCDDLSPVNADDVLVGYQDENNDGFLEPFQAVGVSAALTAGASQGNGYLTVAFNNDPTLNPAPVSLEVIEVGCLAMAASGGQPAINSTYQGQINVIAPSNVFDEQVVMRHSGDFGGNPDALEFEWYYHPDIDGQPPTPPDFASNQLNGWIRWPTPDAQGAVEISVAGANIQTLSDNWYLSRYRGLPQCGNRDNFSLFAGQPGGTPREVRAQLAAGWVKRVLGRLNPFEARVQDFGAAETNNFASMLIQLGERYSGPIALNDDPDNLNSIGLIEAYTTVMRRAMQLSADSTPPIDYGPANAAILLVASRLVDFYTLLGNEAYADAQDPTIAITTSAGNFSMAPTIFNFQNQLDSLLTEELVLLRGRDTTNGPVAASPVYNRLFWNFTTGDGEVAYALSYDVSDQNFNGVIDEFDARIMFPQGHGDAWGHYLTGTKIYYDLLRHPFFSWDPRPEAIAVAGVPLQVDFLDERQFAETAARKARAGAEIVDLTYRSSYVADPEGQWQGYDDPQPQRAWGLSEWGRRAGTGAYFDWLTVNAIVPSEDENPNHVGIQKIERGTVSHLGEISAQYAAVQGQVDKADAGLNPLGLAQNVVPFDFDPTQLDRFNRTQFEQVYERALTALKNAMNVWDYANELTNQLRRTQDNSDELYEHSIEEETDFVNQLIEIFGYPYADDIGPGGTYPAGYDGPDLYHYMLVDLPELAGTPLDFSPGVGGSDQGIARITQTTATYTPMPNGLGFYGTKPVQPGTVRIGAQNVNCSESPLSPGCALGDLPVVDPNNPDPQQGNYLTVKYHSIESPDFGTWMTKDPSWTGTRRAPGRLQQALQQMFEARISLKQAMLEYEKLRQDVNAQMQTLQATFDISTDNLAILNDQRRELRSLTAASKSMEAASTVAKRVGEFTDHSFKAGSECVPKSLIVGLAGGGDILSTARCTVHVAGNTAKLVLDTVADGLEIAGNAIDAAKEDVEQQAAISTFINDQQLEMYNIQGEIEQMLREEPLLRAEIYARTEAIKQLLGDYHATLAEGQRVLDRLIVFRKDGAEDIQLYRFRDMAFRIFRNDALQKYRASFDLAARYVYLAAAAYDYETNLLGGGSQAGQEFLTDIVRERNLGQILGGQPMPGSPGLADTLARLKLNFDVLKGQMGFNNPQVETNRFSLRRELFRIPDGEAGDAEWKRKLESSRVPDLWQVPEFRRYARPFAPESAGPQPGLVLEFSTNVNFGLNFFGWELGPQDSAYDSSQFATRIRSVGAWFADYADLPLADDPRIYVFPVGADVLRAPNGNDFETREWQVIDQAIPVPFPIGSSDLGNYAWNPTDSLSGSSAEIRRYGRIRAYHFSEPFDDTQVTSDSRLIGRSVWNRRWMIVIPGGTLLANPNEGLDTFIHGARLPGGSTVRDGDGIDDIRLFFKTYAYSGN